MIGRDKVEQLGRANTADIERRLREYDAAGEWLENHGYVEGTLVERLEEMHRDMQHGG